MDLKEYLHRKKLNVNDFSRLSGVGYATIHRVLSGCTPKLETAYVLSDATKGAVSVQELVGDVFVLRRMRRAGNKLECACCGSNASIVLVDSTGRKRKLNTLGEEMYNEYKEEIEDAS